jgi:hypothetical protein
MNLRFRKSLDSTSWLNLPADQPILEPLIHPAGGNGMSRNKIAWLVFLVLVWAALLWVGGQDAQTAGAALKGLPGVGVMVADLPEGMVSAGVTAEMVRADVELQLKNAGIRVFTPEERKKTLGRPARSWPGWPVNGATSSPRGAPPAWRCSGTPTRGRRLTSGKPTNG